MATKATRFPPETPDERERRLAELSPLEHDLIEQVPTACPTLTSSRGGAHTIRVSFGKVMVCHKVSPSCAPITTMASR
jgi:hypothetical protein